jgi:hypothetical protein
LWRQCTLATVFIENATNLWRYDREREREEGTDPSMSLATL